jgi:hypothetical protein
MFYSAETPTTHVRQVEDAVKVALQQASVREAFWQLAFEPSGTGSAQ